MALGNINVATAKGTSSGTHRGLAIQIVVVPLVVGRPPGHEPPGKLYLRGDHEVPLRQVAVAVSDGHGQPLPLQQQLADRSLSRLIDDHRQSCRGHGGSIHLGRRGGCTANSSSK